MEAEMITRLSIPFTSIPAAGVHGVGLKTLPSNIARLLRGVAASRRILADFKPDALLFTGDTLLSLWLLQPESYHPFFTHPISNQVWPSKPLPASQTASR
jgi:UDP-N-acetylglucosamine:LPS N-acetylglucosamine transferase